MTFNSYFKILLFSTTALLSMLSYANDDQDDLKDKILGSAGKIKIKQERCNRDNGECDFVLYDAKNKKQMLLKQWNKTAVLYQFTPNLMGFMIGATGTDHNLMVVNDQNQQKNFGSFLAINQNKTCIVTYESNVKNMPDSLVFYSVPDFRVRQVINQKVPQFNQFSYPMDQGFEDDGSYAFGYIAKFDGEMDMQSVVIQNPCQSNYRIIMN